MPLLVLDAKPIKSIWTPFYAATEFTLVFTAVEPAEAVVWPEDLWTRAEGGDYPFEPLNYYAGVGTYDGSSAGLISYRSYADRVADELTDEILEGMIAYAAIDPSAATVPAPNPTEPLAIVADETLRVTCGGRELPFEVTYEDDWTRAFHLLYADDERCEFEVGVRNTSAREMTGISIDRWPHVDTLLRFEAPSCRLLGTDAWGPCEQISLDPGGIITVRQIGLFDGCERILYLPGSGLERDSVVITGTASGFGRIELPAGISMHIESAPYQGCPFAMPQAQIRSDIVSWLEDAMRVRDASEDDLTFFTLIDGVHETTELDEERRLGEHLAAFALLSPSRQCMGIVGYDRKWPHPYSEFDDSEPTDAILFTESLVSHGARCTSVGMEKPEGLIAFRTAVGYRLPGEAERVDLFAAFDLNGRFSNVSVNAESVRESEVTSGFYKTLLSKDQVRGQTSLELAVRDPSSESQKLERALITVSPMTFADDD